MIDSLAGDLCVIAAVVAITTAHLRHGGLVASVVLPPLPVLALARVLLPAAWIAVVPWPLLWLAGVVGGLLWADARLRARLQDGAPADEDFIAGANRMREWEQRQVERWMFAAQPRWSLSVGGIALVFAALALFGATPPAGRFVLGATAAACIVAVAAARDLRAAAAASLTLFLTALIALWAHALSAAQHPAGSAATLAAIVGAASLPVLYVAAGSGRRGRGGEDAGQAFAATLACEGPGVAAGCTALLTGAAAFAAFGGAWPLLLPAAFGALGPLLFQPAFAVLVERLFPRSQTVAARYRRR